MNSTEGGFLSSAYYYLFKQVNQLTKERVDLKLFNYMVLFGVVLIAISIKAVKLKPKKAVKGDNKNRKLGQWIPDEKFKTPKPAPFPDWNIKTTKPQPYRAFKSNYKVNMGIRNMPWDSWIELDNQWPKYHQDKLNRIATKGKELYETSDEAIDAAYELLEEFRNWLPFRYPSLFKQTKEGIYNLETGEDHIFMRKGGKEKFSRSLGEDPILIASKLTQDDLAIMLESESGEYYLKSGAIMLAGFWRFRDKFNLPLSAIHTSGDVPKYQTNLRPGMEKFFIRLTPDKPVVRNNYFIQTDDQLPWSSSIGDELNEKVGWYTAKAATTIEQIYFRSERQSLRRLPRSGGVVFTIRTYFIPMVEICEEPWVPRRLLNGMKSWEEDVADYKGLYQYKDVCYDYLERKALEQEAKGYTVDNDPLKYPF